MARARIPESEDDSADEEDIPVAKTTTGRPKKATDKQSANDKENLEKAEAAFLRAQKKLQKLRRTRQRDP
ncbi:hypothetical protein H0H92_010607, partial [Tricholoma furcatifolium]